MNYTLYDRIYETLKFHKFVAENTKEVFELEGVNRDFLTDKIMDQIKNHFNEEFFK